MNTTEKLLAQNRKTVEIDGMEFVCHRWSFAIAVEAFGEKALGLVNPGEAQKVNTSNAGERREMVRKALTVAMIEPGLGEVDDVGANQVTMRSLGDVAFKLFSALVGEDVEKAGNFHESSEGQTG